jgi:peptide/nickel transport system permease protein
VTLVFAFVRMVPGDPVTIMLGEQARAADIEAMRKDMGLVGPLHVQYARYIRGMLRGDLGKSFSMRKPIVKVIIERYPATLKLALAAMLVALLVSFPLGIISATRPGSAVDISAGAFSLLGVSMPNFWLGPLLILLFSIHLGLTPVSGGGDLSHMILPAITLGAAMAGILARLIRSGLLEVRGAPYIRTAKAKGATGARIIWVHALRNALLPVITVVGLQFGALLAGAVITETVFSWPGVGSLLIEAIRSRDYPLVQGCVLTISVTYVAVNLITDLAYAIVDPRIRLGEER